MQPGTTVLVPPGPCADKEHAFLRDLKQEIGARSFEHWFLGRTSVFVDAQAIRIRVGNPFQLTWMQRKFGANVAGSARLVGGDLPVVWEVDASQPAPGFFPVGDVPTSGADSGTVLTSVLADAPSAVARPKTDQISLAPGGCVGSDDQRRGPDIRQPTSGERCHVARDGRRYASLEEFVVGTCNELAHTAARHVCEAPGQQFNPLYLYGPVGTGKTHLVEGICRSIRRQHPALHVMLMTAEAFANQFTHALRTHALPGFRQRFRSVDVLIIDDVDFLDGKRGMQEEFLHTFQQLATHGRQVILTADSHPRLLTQTSDELVSRFLCGMVCRLEAPEFETRRKIAHAKATDMGASFAPEVLELVARRFTNNVREIEGALNSLHTWQRMTDKRVSLNSAKQLLSDLERDCVRLVKLTDVESVVCELFGLPADDLRSERRTRTVSQPRMLAMYLARKHTQAAYKEIGEHFGGRNHSTVMSAERKVETWLRACADLVIGGKTWRLTDVIERLEQQLQAS